MLRRRSVRFLGNADGAALVEMAIMFPFLLVLAGGVFEFGAFFYQYQMVEAGVRDAARYMARVSNTGNFTCGASGTAQCLTPCDPVVLAEKVGNAKDIAVMGLIGGTDKRVVWWSKADVTVDYATVVANPLISGYPSYRGPTSGIRIIKVSTAAAYPGVGFLGLLGLGASIPINLDHQERCIGAG